MNSRDFCYWLQGCFEITNESKLDENQVKIIKAHLAMVFHHEIDPSFGKDSEALDKLHDVAKGIKNLEGTITSHEALIVKAESHNTIPKHISPYHPDVANSPKVYRC